DASSFLSGRGFVRFLSIIVLLLYLVLKGCFNYSIITDEKGSYFSFFIGNVAQNQVVRSRVTVGVARAGVDSAQVQAAPARILCCSRTGLGASCTSSGCSRPSLQRPRTSPSTFRTSTRLSRTS